MSETGKTLLTRRNALFGVAVVGVGAPLLAACGSSDTATDPGAGSGAGTSGGGSTPSSAGNEVLGPTSDISVGGGKIYADAQVVVTEPTAGVYKGFQAICTHESCLVSSVSDGTINCACHGSRYSIKDGSVVNGPATRPLPPVTVAVTGTNVVLES